MIALATRDDWTGAVLTWDDGGGPQLWSPVDAVDAYSVAWELYAWLVVTYGGAPAVSYADTPDGGWGIAIALGAPYTVAANTAAQTLLRAPAAQGPSTTFTTSAALGIAGTVATDLVALRGWWGDASGSGDAAATGALLLPAPGWSQRRPTLDVVAFHHSAARREARSRVA